MAVSTSPILMMTGWLIILWMDDLIAGKKARLKKSLSSCSTWLEVRMTGTKITYDLPEHKRMGRSS